MNELHIQANFLLDSGKIEEALIAFIRAEPLNANNAEFYNDFGRAYSANGQNEKALECFNRAIEINPQLGVAYYNIGNYYFNNDEYSSAIVFYDNAIKHNSVMIWDVYYMRSHSYFNWSMVEKRMSGMNNQIRSMEYRQMAENDIKLALNTTPHEDKDICFLAGNIYRIKGDLINAKTFLMKAAKLGDEEAKRMLF